MAAITVARRIHAPHDVVFNAVADADAFAHAIPGVIGLEFLSDIRSGTGTRFRRVRSTRTSGAAASATYCADANFADLEVSDFEVSDFEVTEYVANERLRLVNRTRGAIWDSVITVTPTPSATLLTMRSEARTHPLVAKLVAPIAAFFRRKVVEAELDSVKVYCEQPSTRRATSRQAADVQPRVSPA